MEKVKPAREEARAARVGQLCFPSHLDRTAVSEANTGLIWGQHRHFC